jgi:tetratricopeptide (TPR) repeat protein
MTEISLHEYCERIESTIEQARYVEAVAHGQHILRQYPKHVATYRLLGKAMLEAGQDEDAADMFRRVLSADPEDLVAYAGLSEVHSQRGEIDAATWYLERAFELATDKEIAVIEEELRHLYGRRDGVEHPRVQLTRGALARLYLKGDLLSRATGEFRALLDEQPERTDLRVALAEALWRNEQRLEAVEACQQVLDALPYCLKANLILGEIWTSSGRGEGQTYLRRAGALDPENEMAQELFEAASPLPPREAPIVPLEYRPLAAEARPAWMAGLEAVSAEGLPPAERETALFDVTGAVEAQIEIPPWLEAVGGEEEEVVGEEAVAAAPPAPAERLEERPPEEAAPAPAEEVPGWLAGLREGFVEEELEAVAGEEAAERPAGLGLEPVGEEEAAEWLAEREVEPGGVEEAPPIPGLEEVPAWLAALRAEPAGVEEAPPAPAEAEAPELLAEPGVEAAGEEAAWPAELPADWLAGIREQLAEAAEVPGEAPAPEAEEAPAPARLEEVAPAPEAEEGPMPAWLEGEGMPSGDEALAWLEQLAAGKEEELQAQAEAEAEARMAEIMGRAGPAEAPPAEAVAEEAAPEEAAAPPAEEAVAPPVEAPFGWTAFGEPEVAPEAVAPVEEAPPVAEAVPPEIPELAYPEEVEAPPVAEIPAVEEAPPPEGIPAPEVAPPIEEVRWGAAWEVPPEEAAPAPVVEEVPGVVEMEVPAPAEEVVAPPEAPTAEVPAEPLAAQRAYLKDHPRDYEARLALARALWQAGERPEALEAYTRVIRAGKMLESVTADLEGHVEQWPDASTQRALGDAYMKDGRLRKALGIYRRALETL